MDTLTDYIVFCLPTGSFTSDGVKEWFAYTYLLEPVSFAGCGMALAFFIVSLIARLLTLCSHSLILY